ncbi:MAG: YXWGXW repeat-containing protein [Alphaproteobacteria bacterium]|nr:YXWGXW repeat-containing protein [Alphaproteobacteria bacterium]
MRPHWPHDVYGHWAWRGNAWVWIPSTGARA